jgi:serine/threonine protein kinase
MNLAAGTKLGPYVVVGPLGAGGMGEVYRARDERLGREVAVKILSGAARTDPERLRRFELEAKAIGQLDHPNILAVHDAGTHDGVPYVVCELLSGETLRARLDGTALPARKAIEYAVQIAHGLSAAHGRGIVHRDLKPENLFITKDGRLKILDFGLAKLTADEPTGDSDATATQARTGPGVVMGTAGYMSPEQVRGQAVDHRSDIFSFGSVLYEMVSGRRAFQGDSAVETMNAVLRQDPPEISSPKLEVPPAFDRVVRHCLEKNPEERFQSARDLAFQLEALSSSSVSAAHAAQGARPKSRGLQVPLVAGAALAAIAVVAAFFLGRSLKPPPLNPSFSQLTYRQGNLFSGRFTPDGETIVYGASWDGSPVELFTARAGSPESRSLGLPAEILAISSAGEMAVLLDPKFVTGWQRSGTLARAPIAGGAPRPVLAGVQDADWDPKGQQLAVARSEGGRYRLEYPSGTKLYETDAWLSSPRFSRDGKHIAFLEHPLSGDDRGRIATVDLSGRLTPLTEDFSSASGLAWSPDGSEVWFTAGKTGNVRALYAVTLSGKQRIVDAAPADLTVMDVAASGKILLARNSARRGMVAWSAADAKERDLSWLDWSRPVALSLDGKNILFEEQGQGGGLGYSVYLRGMDGSPAVRLSSGTADALSADGKWALTGSLDRRETLTLTPIGPGDAREIRLEGLDITNARWLPDGSGYLLLAREKGQPRLPWLTDLNGGSRRKIPVEGVVRTMSMRPDGKLLAVSFLDGAPALHPVDGGPGRPLPGATPDDIVIGWTGDGRSLYLTQSAGSRAHIDRLDVETGRRASLFELSPADKAGLIDLNNFLIMRDASAYVYSYRKYLSTLYLVEGLR